MNGFHVCIPRVLATARRITRCRRCRRRTRHVQEFFEWYEPNLTCCACGGASRVPADRLERLRAEWRRALPFRDACARVASIVSRRAREFDRALERAGSIIARRLR